MKTVTAMREEIDKLMADLDEQRMRCIREKRDPNEEEKTFAQSVLNRVDELEEVIRLELRTEETRARLGRSQQAPLKPDPNSQPSADKRDQDKFPSLGDQLAAVVRAASPQAFLDPRLRVGSIRDAATGLSSGVPSDGGFLVQQEFVQQLLVRTYETGQVASRCERIGIGENANGLKIPGVDETSRATGSRWGGVRAYWESEGDEKKASKPKFRMIELNLRKLIGLCYATDELLQDATALDSYVRRAFSEEFAWLLDNACIRGTGVGQPLGILNSGCLVTVTAETGQLATTIVSDNIIKMWSRMWAGSRTNAVWFINQDIEPQLFTMGITVGVGGSPIYMPPGGLSERPYGTLFGRPVMPIEQCSTLGTVGDIILANFGDYLLIDKNAMQSAVSIHVRFIYDEQTFRFVYRVDGQPFWNAALTPANGTNTLSPFVVLANRV